MLSWIPRSYPMKLDASRSHAEAWSCPRRGAAGNGWRFGGRVRDFAMRAGESAPLRPRQPDAGVHDDAVLTLRGQDERVEIQLHDAVEVRDELRQAEHRLLRHLDVDGALAPEPTQQRES